MSQLSSSFGCRHPHYPIEVPEIQLDRWALDTSCRGDDLCLTCAACHEQKLTWSCFHSESIPHPFTCDPHRQLASIQAPAPVVRDPSPPIRNSSPVTTLRRVPPHGLSPRVLLGLLWLLLHLCQPCHLSRFFRSTILLILNRVRVIRSQRTISRWLQRGSNAYAEPQGFDLLLELPLSLGRGHEQLRIPPRSAPAIYEGLQMSCAQAQGHIFVLRALVVLAPVPWTVLPAIERCLLRRALVRAKQIGAHQALLLTGLEGVQGSGAASLRAFGTLYHSRELLVIDAKLTFHVIITLHVSTVVFSDPPSERCRR